MWYEQTNKPFNSVPNIVVRIIAEASVIFHPSVISDIVTEQDLSKQEKLMLRAIEFYQLPVLTKMIEIEVEIVSD